MNYYMAKGCVRAGMTERAIEYLRMALNEGFTSPKKLTADNEFAEPAWNSSLRTVDCSEDAKETIISDLLHETTRRSVVRSSAVSVYAWDGVFLWETVMKITSYHRPVLTLLHWRTEYTRRLHKTSTSAQDRARQFRAGGFKANGAAAAVGRWQMMGRGGWDRNRSHCRPLHHQDRNR